MVSRSLITGRAVPREQMFRCCRTLTKNRKRMKMKKGVLQNEYLTHR